MLEDHKGYSTINTNTEDDQVFQDPACGAPVLPAVYSCRIDRTANPKLSFSSQGIRPRKLRKSLCLRATALMISFK